MIQVEFKNYFLMPRFYSTKEMGILREKLCE